MEHEKARLEKSMKDLQTCLTNEKKQKEDLQLHLVTQMEELEAGLAEQRKELEMEYQK